MKIKEVYRKYGRINKEILKHIFATTTSKHENNNVKMEEKKLWTKELRIGTLS